MAGVVGDLRHSIAIGELDGAIKARAATGMAGRIMAGDGDLQPHRVLIAISAEFLHRLQVARCFALLPDLVA
ncbi:hypothetical protein D3C86_1092140 [compost metagenome]